ncbi:membrane protein [Microbacterium phage Zooman]|nr:membrane protein [Microbacterium phage Zooman]
MEKPHGFIWREKIDYEMGRLHVGRVSMSLSMLLALWGIPAFVMFLFGGIIGSAQHSAEQDTTVAGLFMLVGLVMIGIAALVAAIFGLIALVKWIASDIQVEGPRR